MKKYLSTLHTRSESHKKRFAFLVSGGFTLIIFSLWTLATFGTGGTLAQEREAVAQKERVEEVSPFVSLRSGVATGFAGLTEAFQGLLGGLKGATDLNNYGR